jgi:hypothetical protein
MQALNAVLQKQPDQKSDSSLLMSPELDVVHPGAKAAETEGRLVKPFGGISRLDRMHHSVE